MNLDLLIKLIKLANNNPNENESNLAARKVCKMIAEADYKFTQSNLPSNKATHIPTPQPGSNDWLNEILKNMRNAQWSSYDQERQYWAREAEERSKQQQYYRPSQAQQNYYDKTEPKESIYVTFDAVTREYILPDKSRVSEHEFHSNPKYYNKYKPKPTYSDFVGGQKGGQKKEKEKKLLKCCICGEEFVTGFVGPPQVFRCNKCDWDKYEKEKEKW